MCGLTFPASRCDRPVYNLNLFVTLENEGRSETSHPLRAIKLVVTTLWISFCWSASMLFISYPPSLTPHTLQRFRPLHSPVLFFRLADLATAKSSLATRKQPPVLAFPACYWLSGIRQKAEVSRGGQMIRVHGLCARWDTKQGKKEGLLES